MASNTFIYLISLRQLELIAQSLNGELWDLINDSEKNK